MTSPTPKEKTRTYVKHDYHDHFFDPFYDYVQAEVEREEGSRRGPRGGVVEPFPSRLYHMLKAAEEQGFEEIVSWQSHGRCFVVHGSQQFVDEVMPKYFRQSKLTSFKRQVNLYGFKRLTRGPDRTGYYHPLFLRGRLDLSRSISRMRVKGTGAKPTSSPESEPDLYAYPYCYERNLRQVSVTSSQEGNRQASVTESVSGPLPANGDINLADNSRKPDLPRCLGSTSIDTQQVISNSNRDLFKPVKTAQQHTHKFAATENESPENMDTYNISPSADPSRDNNQVPFPLVASLAKDSVPLMDKIHAICSDSFPAHFGGTESSVGDDNAVNFPRDRGLGPLQSPPVFQNFKNFKSLPKQLVLDGSNQTQKFGHRGGRHPAPAVAPRSEALGSSITSDCAIESDKLSLAHNSEFQVCEDLSEGFKDPFQDQLAKLIEDPSLAIGKNNVTGEEDTKAVFDWFSL